MPIHSDRTIAANRADVVLKNKKDKACLVTDMTIYPTTPMVLGTIKKDIENYSSKIPGNINIHEL